MTDAADVWRQWEEFINPEIIQSKFQLAGLFLVAYETLKSSIIRHPLDFFSNHWTLPDLKPEETPKYRQEVLALDPKEKGDRLRGSLAFLRANGVISEEDETTFRIITDARNNVAHELDRSRSWG
jgi:hypothetical protein